MKIPRPIILYCKTLAKENPSAHQVAPIHGDDKPFATSIYLFRALVWAMGIVFSLLAVNPTIAQTLDPGDDIQVAINNSANSVITLAAGEHDITAALQIPAGRSITIKGAGAGLTTIKQTGTKQRVLTVGTNGGSGGTLVLEDLTITGGNVVNGEGGGGIYIWQGWTVKLNRVVVSGNSSSGQTTGGIEADGVTFARSRGGGIFNNRGTLILTDSEVSDNITTGNEDGWGGGIYNHGGLLRLSRSKILDNHAAGLVVTSDPEVKQGTTDSRGGGIYTDGSIDGSTVPIGKLEIMDSEISGNKSDCHGGGIFIEDAVAVIVGSRLIGNLARFNTFSQRGEGGAMHVLRATSKLTVFKSEIKNNKVLEFNTSKNLSLGNVYRYSGGVHFQGGATGYFRSTVFDGNLIEDNYSGIEGTGNFGLPEGLNHHIGIRDDSPVDMALNYWGDGNGPDTDVERCDNEGCAVDLTLGFNGTGQGVVNPTHDSANDAVFDGIFQALADAKYQDINTKADQFLAAIGVSGGSGIPSSDGEKVLSIPQGSKIKLSAVKTGTSTFTGWDGDGDPGNTTPVLLTMDEDKSVTATFSPGPAHTITLTGPTEGVAGLASGEFTLTVVDADGNTKAVSTDTKFELSSDGDGVPSFDPSSPVTVSAGSASVTFKYANTKAGDYTITATRQSGETLAGESSGEADITIKAADISVGANGTLLSVDETERIAGVEIAVVSVQLKDAYGNNIHQQNVEVAFTAALGLLDNGDDPAAASVTVLTDANGLATATLASSEAGEAEITATVSIEGTPTAIANGSPATVDFVAGAPDVETSIKSVAPTSVLANGNNKSTLTVTVKDGFGNAITNLTEDAFEFSAIGGATIGDFAGDAGVYTFSVTNNTAETLTIGLTVDETDLGVFEIITFRPVPNAGQSELLANPSSVLADGSDKSTLTVTVKDGSGNAITNLTEDAFEFRNKGNATIGDFAGDAGVYTFSVTNNTAETVTIGVTVDGTDFGDLDAITFRPVPDAAKSGVSVSPASVIANGSSYSTLTVTVHDAADAPIVGLAADVFEVELNVEGDKSNTAAFTNFTDLEDGQYTFRVTNTVAESGDVQVKVEGITITQQPELEFTGQVVDPDESTFTVNHTSLPVSDTDNDNPLKLTITIKDADGQPIAGRTVTLAQNEGASSVITPSSSTGTSGADGVVIFEATNEKAENVTYTATVDGVVLEAPQPIQFSYLEASQTRFEVQPSDTEAGVAIAPSVKVRVEDRFGNLVTNWTQDVTVKLTVPGDATLGGKTVVKPPVSGVATFDDLTVDLVGTYTLDVTTYEGRYKSTSTSFEITAGAPAEGNSTVTSSSPTVTADGSTESTITVTVKDANGNAVEGETVMLLQNSGAASTISPVSGGTSSSTGVVTFSVKSTKAETVTYTAIIMGTPDIEVTQTAEVTFTAGAPTAANSTVAASPSSITANGSTESTVTVTVKDANDNPVEGETVTLAQNTGAASTISPASGTSDASGKVAFAVTSTKAEKVTYTATISSTPDIVITEMADVTFTAGAPTAANSTVAASPSSVTADGSTESTITVTVKDANGNPVSGETVTLAQGTGSSTISPTSGTSDASGKVTFTVTSTKAELVTYTATISGTPEIVITEMADVTFTAGAAAASTTTADVPSGTAGSITTITVTVRDANGNVVTGVADDLSGAISGDNTASLTFTESSPADGTYTATYTPTKSGDDDISIELDGTAIDNSPYSSAVSAGAADATTTTADVPAGTAGSETTITVTVRDANGNIVTGAADDLSGTVSGDNTASLSFTESSPADGTYTATYTPTKAGTDEVAIKLGGTAIDNSPYNSTISAGAANATTTTADVPAGTAGSETTITVTVRDANGNIVTGAADDLSGTVSGVNTASLTFTESSPADGTYTATYTPTKSGDDDIGITLDGAAIKDSPYSSAVSAGAASQLSIGTQPVAGASGSTLTAQPVIHVLDAHDNIVTSDDATVVTVGIGDGDGGTLGGTLTATATDGVATFSGVSLTGKVGEDYTLIFKSVPVLESVESIDITLTGPDVPTAGNSTVAADPSSVTANGSTESTITVTVKDANDNPVSGETVTLAQGTGSSTIFPTSGPSDASGKVTFTVTSTKAEKVTYTATISSTPDIVIIETADVTFTADVPTAANSTVVADPATVTADGNTESTITVTVKDANDNPVSGETVTLTQGTGSSTISAASGTSDASGKVTFTVTSTKAEKVTYTATVGSTEITQTADVTFTAGTADASTTTADVPAGIAGESTIVTITVLDEYDNPVTGVSGDLSVTVGGSNAGTSVSSVTDNGEGTYKVSYTPTKAGDDEITVTLGGTEISGSPYSSTVSAGELTKLVILTQPGETAQSGELFNQQPVIEFQDAFGNPASPERSVKIILGVTIVQGEGTLINLAARRITRDTKGWSFTDLGITGKTGTYRLEVSLETSPYNYDVTPVTFNAITLIAGTPDASTTTAIVTSGTAGETSTITITVRDNEGNPVAGLPVDNLSITITGANAGAAVSTITDNGDGTYTATYTPTKSGTDDIAIKLNGTDIQNSPYNSAVSPGPASLTISTITASPSTMTTDGSTVITVQLKDAFGNSLRTSGGTMALFTTVGTLSTVDDHNDGTYTATLSSSAVGTAVIRGELDGAPLTADLRVIIGVGAPSVTAAVLTASPTTMTTDDNSVITVQLKDAVGNNLITSGGTVALSTTVGVLSSVTDNADGTYSAVLTSDATGTALITATLDGVGLTDDASVTIKAGAVSVSETAITALPTTITTDGSSTISVQLKDAAGNKLNSSAGTVALHTTTGVLSGVTDNHDGTYTATLTSATSGTAVITGTLEGTGITQEASVTITVGAPSLATTTITASPSAMTTDDSSIITVQLKDASGNDLDVTGGTLVLNTTVGRIRKITDHNDGTYTATLISSATGTATITGILSGNVLTNQVEVTIAAGAADADKTTADVPAGTAGSVTTITVTIRDAHGNVVMGAADKLSANISGANSGSLTFTEASPADGTYTATYTPTVAGTDNIRIELNNETIGGSPYASVVSAGAATQLAVITQPVAGASGAALATQPVIEIRDTYGNLVIEDDNTTVTVSIGNGDKGTLDGMTTVTASSGVITFTDVILSGIKGEIYRLDFTANTALTSATSEVSVTGHGKVAQLVLAGAVDDLASGNTRSLTVILKDASGNTITDGAESTLNIRFSQQGGDGSLAGLGDVTASGGSAQLVSRGEKAGLVTVVAHATLPSLSSNAISFRVTVDKTALQVLVDDAETLEEKNYSTASWSVYETALNNARSVLADPHATQTAIDKVAEDLTAAKASLVQIQGAGAPVNLIGTAGDGAVVLSWEAPADNGYAEITDYSIQYSTDNGLTWQTYEDGLSKATHAKVAGLANNRAYIFRVAAINEAGIGSFSEATPALIPTVPVPDENNVLPQPEIGEGVIIVEGKPQPVTLQVVADSILRLSGDGFAMDMTSIGVNGKRIPISDINAVIRILKGQGAMVRLSGYGFEPGTFVSVYMFSTPVLLGQIPVQVDGTFDGVLPVPADLSLGRHTLQANGLIRGTLVERSVSVGVEVVERLAQQITFNPLPDRTFGDENVSLEATSNSGLPIEYSVTDTDGKATDIVTLLSGNQLKLNGAGRVLVTAEQLGSGIYAPAVPVVRELVVQAKELHVSAKDVERVYGEDNPLVGLVYDGFVKGDDRSSLDEEPITQIDANEESAPGDYGITLSGGVSDNYTFVYHGATLRIHKAAQTISFAELGEVDRDAGSIPLEVSSSSGLPVHLTLDDELIASLSGMNLDILRLGTVRVTATQEGNENYLPAEPVTITVQVVDPDDALALRVHKALSPNGDGINEFLMVEGIEKYPDNRLIIMNRNGNKVTEIIGYNNGERAFRGIGLGQEVLPAGTYYYVLNVKVNGEWKYRKGYFVIRY